MRQERRGKDSEERRWNRESGKKSERRVEIQAFVVSQRSGVAEIFVLLTPVNYNRVVFHRKPLGIKKKIRNEDLRTLTLLDFWIHNECLSV